MVEHSEQTLMIPAPQKKIKKVKKKIEKQVEKRVEKKRKIIVEDAPQEVIEIQEEVKNVESHVLVTPPPLDTPQEEYVEENLAKIIELLQENLYYPRRARKRGVQGEVVVSFKLSTSAEVSDVKIVSSQSDILSRGAIRTIENLSFKFPKPKENLDLSVPIYYKLQ